MEKIIIAIIVSIFSISFCLGQNVNIQGAVKDKKELEHRYQNAIESAQKNFSQRQFALAKQDYLIALELKPENADLINEIIAEIDKLLPLNTNQNKQEIQNTASGRSSPATNYTGTTVPGETLTAKLDWLVRNAESHNTYIVEVNANENIAPRTLEYRGAINITIVLRGDYINRTIRLSSHGSMFSINSNVTFILDNNITLQGHNNNQGTIIYVNGGTLIMNAGATITGNITPKNQNRYGAGVHINDGTFEMNGGAISGNSTDLGGAVYVGRGTFNMDGGAIFNNAAYKSGGGIHAIGSFTLSGGTISNNSAEMHGGGVYMDSGILTMRDGNIQSNTANGNGGGVYSARNFKMSGGTISGNSAREYGGGVYTNSDFVKTGGIITGYNSNQSNGNVVKDDSGVLARRGHAAFFQSRVTRITTQGSSSSLQRKETTADTGVNLSSSNAVNWDQ